MKRNKDIIDALNAEVDGNSPLLNARHIAFLIYVAIVVAYVLKDASINNKPTQRQMIEYSRTR